MHLTYSNVKLAKLIGRKLYQGPCFVVFQLMHSMQGGPHFVKKKELKQKEFADHMGLMQGKWKKKYLDVISSH